MVQNVFQYTLGELELALTNDDTQGNFTWEFLQDVQRKDDIVRVETFKYGDCYGVLRKDQRESKSFLKFHGETWYLSTDNNGTPFLQNLDSNRLNKSYVVLQEVYNGILNTPSSEEAIIV